jgi:hypothetical protein
MKNPKAVQAGHIGGISGESRPRKIPLINKGISPEEQEAYEKKDKNYLGLVQSANSLIVYRRLILG